MQHGDSGVRVRGTKASRFFRASVLLVLLPSFAGCYVYVPATELPPPGSPVRAEVSPEAAQSLVSRFGPGVVSLNGLLIHGDEQEFSLSVESARTLNRGHLLWNGETIRLDRTQVVRAERRQFSAVRTALFTGAVLAALSTLKFALLGGGFTFSDPDRGEPAPY